MAESGVINVLSAHDVATTANRFEAQLHDKGMTVFTRINHASEAAAIGKKLRPTELIIFGNPKIGSILMQCQQSMAIDLPQKALIWQDETANIWLSYNDPNYLIRRHDVKNCEAAVNKLSTVIQRFAKLATEK